MKRNQPESRLQRQIVTNLARLGFRAVHIPNGSKLAGTKEQRARAGARLKADGMVPGWPDLLVYGSQGRIGHLEIKAPKGTLSEAQKAAQADLEVMGHKYAVCRSLDDVIDALDGWGWL